MCGFLGIASNQTIENREHYKSFSKKISHRGNTSEGEFHQRNISLFHYRLAFRDLKQGAQPMESENKKLVIVYNGELYGHHPLRTELKKNYSFNSTSDTEVILNAFNEYKEKIIHHIDGEFAFGIYHFEQNELHLMRDPFGVKPLFWANESILNLPKDFFRHYESEYHFKLEGPIFFASEIKAIPIKPEWNEEGVRRQVCGLYEEMGTQFQNILQLAPGSIMQAKLVNGAWECVLKRLVNKNRTQPAPSQGNEKNFWAEAKELRKIVSTQIKEKLDSDVPLGVYLSGGIDSRIAAYEMAQQGNKFDTFTVGFEGADYDETQDVIQFTKSIPNARTRLLHTTNEALAYSYEHAIYASELIQPYTNGCAKWWLSRFARRYVRGVLTGDGADEIFCGYPSYRYLAWWQFYARNPSEARAALYGERVEGRTEKFWEKGLSSKSDGSDLLASKNFYGWMHPLFSQIHSMNNFAGFGNWLESTKESIASYIKPGSPLTQWQNYFLHTHFPTHILNWVGDRMEMANTLEGRPIYLSKKILEFQKNLPDHFLVRGMRDKAILRESYKDVLGDFARSPKKQFNAPFLQDGELAKKFLNKKILQDAGLFDPELLNKLFAQESTMNPLERSYLQMFRQNIIVLHMHYQFFVEGTPPARDLAYEEKFMDEHTNTVAQSNI